MRLFIIWFSLFLFFCCMTAIGIYYKYYMHINYLCVRYDNNPQYTLYDCKLVVEKNK